MRLTEEHAERGADAGEAAGEVRVLVVDDDARVRAVVKDYLEEAGCAVAEAADGKAMRGLLEAEGFDVVLLDVVLPGEDGISLLRDLRARDSDLGVIMLTVRGAVSDRLAGLELGADDYVPKPFHLAELHARVRALGRRVIAARGGEAAEAGPGQEAMPEAAGWRLDRLRRRVHAPGGAAAKLTNTEAALLGLLLSRPGGAVSREALRHEAGQGQEPLSDRAIDVHVGRLRQKLASVGGEGLVQTLRGRGYRFAPPGEG